MAHQFGDTTLVGCTTAGELGPDGLSYHGLSGVSFSSDHFMAAAGLFEHLQHFDLNSARQFARALDDQLAGKANPRLINEFAWLMIDGLSVREELVAWAFQGALNPTPLAGGSAGDDLALKKTHVYFRGRFHSDAALLTLVKTDYAIKPFMSQHFVPSERRMVVTEADPDQRLVREIDGLPAADIYAHLVGVKPEDLNHDRFALAPVVVTIGGDHYVRSISHALADGSLKFYCAIDEGMVLRLAHGVNLVERLQQLFSSFREALPEPLIVLACDCILRRVEMKKNQQIDMVANLIRENHVVGFNSYGEQYRGVHINQTFTGIAIGTGLALND
jgi:hypothetical protein